MGAKNFHIAQQHSSSIRNRPHLSCKNHRTRCHIVANCYPGLTEVNARSVSGYHALGLHAVLKQSDLSLQRAAFVDTVTANVSSAL